MPQLSIIICCLLQLKLYLIKVAGVENCFHNGSLCDMHPQCDPAEGSDTAEDEHNCDEEYRKKGLIPKQASFRCQSPQHNEETVKNKTSLGVVWLRAAPNDGKSECWMGEDEIERSTEWVSYFLPGLELSIVTQLISLFQLLSWASLSTSQFVLPRSCRLASEIARTFRIFQVVTPL